MGFSDDYKLLAQQGDQVPSNDQIATVYVYPNVSGVEEWIEQNGTNQEVANSLDSGLYDLYWSNAIEYYEVYEYTGGYPELPDSTRSEYKTAFEDWLKNTLSDDYYPNRDGCHFGVTNGFDDAGGGFQGEQASDTAFVTSNWMVLGTGSRNTSRIKSFAIQEPLHCFISHDVAVNNNLARSGCSCHEHDLGQIASGGAVTPMATTWTACSERNLDGSEDYHASHGSGLANGCDTGNSCAGTYTQDLTSCTIDAVDYTGDAALNDY